MTRRPDQLQAKRTNRFGNFFRLYGYIFRYRQTKVLVSLIALATFFEVMTPAVIGIVIDMIHSIAEGSPVQAGAGIEGTVFDVISPVARWVSSTLGYGMNVSMLWVFSLSLIAIAATMGLVNFSHRYLSAYASQRASFDIRRDLYNSLLKQSFSFYDRQRTGQIMARATSDITQIERMFDMGIRMVLSSALLIMMVMYALATIDLRLMLITVVFLPFALMTVLRFGSKSGPLWSRIRDQYGNIASVFQENITGIKVVRGFAREDFEERKIAGECQEYFDTNMVMVKLRSFYLPLATLITSLGFVAIIWYGGGQVVNGALTMGSLVAFYFYLAQLTQPVRRVGMTAAMFVRAGAASSRVFETMDVRIEVSEKPNAVELGKLEGRVTLKDVSFGYDGRNMVLRNIDLDVKPGETVAILGATGSGKSSIISLIPRFYDVNEGSIKVDGHDVRDVTVKSLRNSVGIVRQDPFIFSTTIRENIKYGVSEVTDKEIEEAAERAKIHDYIASLPEGYSTVVGERGVTLSGGQKQRIAIARALLKNPKILILDDSTSSVDTQTEYEIQQALEELLENRTTFIITQRLSSIKKADRIVVLDNGEIVEEGSHDELLALNGIYSKLYMTQVGDAGREDAN